VRGPASWQCMRTKNLALLVLQCQHIVHPKLLTAMQSPHVWNRSSSLVFSSRPPAPWVCCCMSQTRYQVSAFSSDFVSRFPRNCLLIVIIYGPMRNQQTCQRSVASAPGYAPKGVCATAAAAQGSVEDNVAKECWQWLNDSKNEAQRAQS
jgi:hypothetical protein